MSNIIDQLKSKEKKISVIGLGYVGLPLAIAFAQKYSVVAYDHDERRIAMLKHGEDPNHEIPETDFANLDIHFSSDEKCLDEAHIHIVAIPTPIDKFKKPDISLLRNATGTVARHLKRGDIVVFESTVYPCCTEEECLPILESVSNLKVTNDFGLGYSPERINPGDKMHKLKSVVKVVSAIDEATRDTLSALYASVIDAGVYIAPSIRVAEAAKILENTQRDVNIALMNELSIILAQMDIDTHDVINAAATKWNFIRFMPGLVGGHCISVDPYYLDYKASELGYHTQIINRGRFVNDNMSQYVVSMTIKKMLNKKIDIANARVLILGLTYKENVSDIRNSRTIDICNELNAYGIKYIDVVDPIASAEEAERQYNIKLQKEIGDAYDVIIITVGHDCFARLDHDFFTQKLRPDGIVCDVKGIFRNRFNDIDMWHL